MSRDQIHLLAPQRLPPAPPLAGTLDALLHAGTTDSLERAVTAATRLVAGALRGADGPFTGADPSALGHRVGRVDLDRPLADLDDALREVQEVYLDDAVWFHHPRYVAHLNCPVAVPALAADVIASVVNSSMDTWDQSAGATMIERRLVAWTATRVGLGPTADGVFTSGGTQSNLQALLLAREQVLSTTDRTAGSPDLRRLRVLASHDAHFSVTKAASLLGLGDEAVVPVDLDERRRMDPEALSRALTGLRAQHLVPMAVVATAGTTDFGSVDPLAATAGLCRAHGVWLHVDAAYGGGLLVSPQHRDRLAGIEGASSVTVDFHKTFFQPVASSVVLVRDRRTLRHATHHADYLNPRGADPVARPNQVDKSLQTTRRFDALKLWVTLRTMGPDAVGAALDACIALAEDAGAALTARPDVELALAPQLSTLVFRVLVHGTDDEVDRANRVARDRLFASGEGAVAATSLAGRTWLKLTLLNPATTLADLEHVVDRLSAHARAAAAEPRAREEAG